MTAITIADLSNARFDVDHIAALATSTAPTATDRLGNVKKTLSGVTAAMLASAAAVQGSIGYLPPVAYAAGLSMTLAAQTVSYAAQTYAPILSMVPFTTSGTFESAKFRLIQGVAAIDLAAPGGAGLVNTIALGSGLVQRSVEDVLRDSLSIKAGGAIGGGVVNDGPGVRSVNDSMGILGGEIKVTIGTYRLDALGGSALTLTKPVSLRGDGGVYTAFNPDLASSDDNTIAVVPSAEYDHTGMRISGLSLHNPSTGQRTGNNGIYASTNAAGSNLAKFTLRDSMIGQGSNENGFAFFHYNNPAANINGGLFGGLFDNSIFKGGIKLDSVGDSNSIVHSVLTGNQIGLVASLVPGASLLEVQANNITASRGSIRFESGSRFRLVGNNCEHNAVGAAHYNNGALCNINGDNAVMYGGVIKENLFSAFGESDATTLIRLRNARGILVEDNVFLSGQAGRVGIDIGADCFDVRVGANAFNAAVSTKVIDNGIGTMGVLKTPPLQNGWIAFSASFGTLQYIKSSDGMVHVTGSVKGGITANGTLIATLGTGFRPTKIMRFPAVKLEAGIPGMAIATLEPSGDFRFNYASADEMTVNFTFPADNLANCISLE